MAYFVLRGSSGFADGYFPTVGFAASGEARTGRGGVAMYQRR
jgi:hypothetical protein